MGRRDQKTRRSPLPAAEHDLHSVENASSQAQRIPKDEVKPEKKRDTIDWLNLISTFSAAIGAIAAAFTIFVMMQQARDDSRAWILPHQVKASPLESGKELALSIIVKNSGRTPATMRLSTRYALGPPGMADEKLSLEDPGNLQEGSYLLPPDVSMTIVPRFKTALTDGGVNAFKAGTSTLYVIGRISYDDIFGAPHETRFCFYASAERWNDGIMHSYKWGNTSD